MSSPKTGWIADIPFAFGVIGRIGAGWLSDFLSGRGISPVNSCKIPIVVGLGGMAGFTVVAAMTPSTFIALAAISTALLFNGMPARCAGLWPASSPPANARRPWAASKTVAGISEVLRRRL